MMMKAKFKLTFLSICLFMVNSWVTYGQNTELEAVVKGRMGDFIIVAPAQYDESIFPQINQNVQLLIYIKDDLPEGKSEGYYDLFEMSFIETMPPIKQLRFKLLGNIDDAKTRHGINSIELKTGVRIKIKW